MGVDYFHDPTDVIDFIRAQEERNDDFGGTFRKRKEAITLPSPCKRSRKSRIQEEFVHATSTTDSTSTTIKSTVVATRTTKKEQPSMKKWWFHHKALPSFRQVWNILHTKLDFLYGGGCYKLPSGNEETFSCDYDMRCHLLQHGIPNIHRLDPDDVTLLTRWVTFAHVPVKDTNSIVKLENMQELTAERALAFLHKINFVQTCNDGSIRRGDSEEFASLQEVRDYLRASSSLTPPILQGRRARGKKFEITLSENQVLELRLWAALSPTPLPTFPQDDAEQQATTLANGASTSTETADEKDDDAAMELDQDESRNGVKSNTNSIVFAGSDDDEDGVPPNFASSIRVSMSPSLFDYQPMTQQE
jgi:hypothetical protein